MDAHKLIDNFSTHLKNVIARAISTADSLHNEKVEPIHLLYALSQEKGSIGAEILNKLVITEKLIFENAIKFKQKQDINKDIPELGGLAKKIIEKALILAHDRKHNYIGTEHLLFGISESDDKELNNFFATIALSHETLAKEISLAFSNVDRFSQIEETTEENFSDIIQNLTENSLPEDTNGFNPDLIPLLNQNKTKNKQNILNLFTKDLTTRANQEKIDPVIGREAEIERIINILARRTKNNPILVGEPGVGKTAIVEGLAKKISEKKVPEFLKRKKILSLDLTSLISGTIYRGEFESRLKQIIDECAKNPNYILFIDELHNIIGAGSNQGTMDAANILKPALARGELRCIGATTLDEYKKYISNDPALERRFQKIDIEEPTISDTIKIIKGIKKYYENFHNVIINDEIIEETVKLSDRYTHDNFQPDKSIDLIDEACGLAKMRQKLNPDTKKINEIEMEIEEKNIQKEEMINKENLKEALKIKKEIQKLEKKITELKTKKIVEKKNKLTLADIRHVLAEKIHLDEKILSQDEWENLKNLEKNLNQKIIGQETAIKTLCDNLKKSYLGIKKDKKPLASFLFVGPSGVGKTELAKILATELYHDEKSLIKINMTEFTEGHSVSKFLGSPAGYIGYKDRNPLIEKIKQRPYSVILFDEIDKAHNDIKKLLLQILDEGFLNDNNGKKIIFKHSVIVLTANFGSDFYKKADIGFGENFSKDKKINETVQKNIIKKAEQELGTDLIGRLNEVCVFNPLSEDSLEIIIKKDANKIAEELQKDLKKVFDQEQIKKIKEKINVHDFGARQIEKELEKTIHEFLLAEKEK
ncbi:MAG: ATP-dependent Clp protease ATP-binding subunit [Patescibacteria group bacterium]